MVFLFCKYRQLDWKNWVSAATEWICAVYIAQLDFLCLQKAVMNGICLWNILLLVERRLQDMLCVAIALFYYYGPSDCFKSLRNIHLLCINGTAGHPSVPSYTSLFRSDPTESCPAFLSPHTALPGLNEHEDSVPIQKQLRTSVIPWCWQRRELNWFISSSAPMIWNYSNPCIFSAWNAELGLGWGEVYLTWFRNSSNYLE